ncbi:vacuolar protein sorting-associated protein 11 homolog [Xenia sp. Carnegie-2017]|uniref:vacuolar protein sorting-associated protein 11 homolog n=1 Tax=Xenia sp. Carnegie-2017 TaxID=2897299 RepID=UPI001F04455A|nr:vacuolar protein sorting-associated protein 11 homolog [Xenia sp. Carnegie-2017]
MAMLQWRRFNFFEKDVAKNVETKQPWNLLKDVNIVATTSGRGQLIAGDIEGNIYFLDRNLNITSIKAFEIRVSHLCQLRQYNILVSIGEDEVGINPLIKVWNLDKTDKLGNPLCMRITRALPGNKPVAVTCLSVYENLTQMAVGFEDGSVVVYKGDVTKDRHSKSHVIHQDNLPITSLSYKQVKSHIILFVTTVDSVISYNTSAKDQREVLDMHGCNPRCSVLSDMSQESQFVFVVARKEALYFYQPDCRGAVLPFEGEKSLISWHRGYLVVVSNDMRTIPGQSSTRPMSLVTIYDIQNKFIAFSGPLPSVFDVLSEWGCLYVLTSDNTIYQFQEKDTQTKLEILFKKNLYAVAIDLARSLQYSDGLIAIFTQYGDHLYSKGDHDGAIKQYIKTIGYLEPSYVIRKFLDAQRIHNLTAYLQALHEKNLANADHTTLLLNCYTKLKDVSKLDEFIMTDKEFNFDVETAIKVCRQAAYFNHALYLAEKYEHNDWYLKIQLEDTKKYQKALNYIGKLNFQDAKDNLKKYGKTLMEAEPDKTTELLKLLCTDYRSSESPLLKDEELAGNTRRVERAEPETFIHIFVHKKNKLIEFLEHMTRVRKKSSTMVCMTLLELYLNKAKHCKTKMDQVEPEAKALSLLQNFEGKYEIDNDHAMVLSQMHNFKAGILLLYEKSKLFHQILRYHMEHDEHVNVMETCRKYGSQDSNLWVQALSYFASKENDCRKYIMEVLNYIDRHNLLPPLLVLQTLAHSSTATLSVVKDYIIKRLQQEDEQIAEDERLIRQYREETEKMRNQIKELKTSAIIFQSAKCSLCSRPLELPVIHFFCQHSFHTACFEGYAEKDDECPICAPENRKVLDIIRAQEEMKDLHDQFHNQLERANDGFSVVADYFGRGVFNKVTIVTDQTSKKQKGVSALDEQTQRNLLMSKSSGNPFL